jgi:hypothetical protein
MGAVQASIRGAAATPNPVCWKMMRSPIAKPDQMLRAVTTEAG